MRLPFLSPPERSGIVKVQLGSFTQVAPGWVNTDATPHILVSRLPGAATALNRLGLLGNGRLDEHRRGVFRELFYLDVRKRFPFADETVDYFYTSHMLEHLLPQDGAHCLRESFRALKPGGLIRIVIPDLDYHVHRYEPTNPNELLDAIYSYERGTRSDHGHKWWYNEHSLRTLLEDIGFREATRYSIGEGRCPDLDVLDRRPLSLFMEAVKPAASEAS